MRTPYSDRFDETRIAVLLRRNRDLGAELDVRNRQLCGLDTALDRIIERNMDEQELLGQLQRSLDLRTAEIAALNRQLDERATEIAVLQRLLAERDESIAETREELHDFKFVANLRSEVIAQEREAKENALKRLATLEQLNEATRECEALDREGDEILAARSSAAEFGIDLEFRPIAAHAYRWKKNSLPQGYRYNFPL